MTIIYGDGRLLSGLVYKKTLFIRHRTRGIDTVKDEIVFNLNKVATWLQENFKEIQAASGSCYRVNTANNADKLNGWG
ncbi:hypothetical protein D3C80_1818050 [compost metagenome]